LLIVDDDWRTLDALKRIFADRGWEVCSAGSMAEGLTQLEPPPRCVLVDLTLPDDRGESMVKRIRQDDRPIRIVVWTGCGDPARLAAVRDLGADVILQKPVDPDELFRACESQLL
jgi:two-component system response regulator RegA